MISPVALSAVSTFNFTVPFLSWLAVVVLTVVTTVLYNIPIRYLVMLFGVHKFSKKLLRPNAIPNNELLDFLSRVPDNDQLVRAGPLLPSLNGSVSAGSSMSTVSWLKAWYLYFCLFVC